MSTPTPPFHEVFAELQVGPLSGPSTRAAFDAILTGAWNEVQVGGFLTALRIRGENVESIAAAASSMRANMVPVEHSLETVLDTCGTGGDGSGTLNLSTGAAIICASLGIPVAKHGNRAISSQAGSADVLQALGIPLVTPEQSSRLLAELGLTFMAAPTHHPAMRFAMPVRKALGVRTVFNCLGPLANPASATHQLVGAFDDALRPIMAETLRELGSRRAWVVRGEDGLDEISPYTSTNVTQLADGKIEEFQVTPQTFGEPLSPPGAASGSDAATNARIIEDVLQGKPHPSRSAFVINAAAALVVVRGLSPTDAADFVRDALDGGYAIAKLKAWRAAIEQITGQE